MSVLGYLQGKASAAVLSGPEKESIDKSISTLTSRIASYFEATLVKQFRFGSSTRGTILPRSMDEASDIDYMVVLNNDGTTSQTFLNRMKVFAEKCYSTSEIYQSSPTIVLELNHIKFDLVPAITSPSGGYQIPDGSSGWKSTNPNDFNQNHKGDKCCICLFCDFALSPIKWNTKVEKQIYHLTDDSIARITLYCTPWKQLLVDTLTY